jgi:hypothetical protein
MRVTMALNTNMKEQIWAESMGTMPIGNEAYRQGKEDSKKIDVCQKMVESKKDTRLLLGLQFRDDISMYPFGQCIYIEPD